MSGEKPAFAPLADAAPALARLDSYESSAQLRDAVRTVHAAVERSLRLLLRSDPAAPDELRLSALSDTELPLDRVVAALRERDAISLEVAGAIHELSRAATREQPRAGDADIARRAVEGLRQAGRDVGTPAAPARRTPSAPGARIDEVRTVPPPDSGRGPLLAGALLLAAVAATVIFLLFRGGSRVEEGIEAFRRGDMLEAAEAFEQVLERAPDDATARLYLARIGRRAGRHAEAAEHLRVAAASAPEDADVRRELGHLFMELGRSEQAAEQYRRAVEIEPGSTLAWVGLVRALQARGDPEAEEVLRRAPDAAREALGLP